MWPRNAMENVPMSTHFTPDAATTALLAPTGRLRASINLGNPILAGTDTASGAPRGVSVDLAQALAERLGVPLNLVTFPAATKSVDAVTSGVADIGFFAIDPLRAAEIAFTDAYILIEGAYLVRDDSPGHANEDVDQPGTSIVVGKGSAYDLFLSRELKHAGFVRVPGAAEVVETLLAGGADVAGRHPAGARRSRSTHAGACACCRADSWSSARRWASRARAGPRPGPRCTSSSRT